MTLAEALDGFSQRKFYEICGYTYRSLNHGGHGELTFDELNPKMQQGMINLIHALYRVQKMVYDYDLAYFSHCLKSCGVQLGKFYEGCDITKTFHDTLSLTVDRDARLMTIRLELIIIINRLFSYVLD